MLRIHFIQQWLNLSDPAMEEALYDTPMFREFAGLDMGEDNLPDESTILRFRHLLEIHNLSLQILAAVNATLTSKGLLLKSGTVVDATLIAAPSSTKNSSGERDPEMQQIKKGISRAGQEPRTTTHTVCSLQFVAGAANAVAGYAGMSARARRQRAANRGENTLYPTSRA